tara:strand:- start:19921 stop:20643 length:723 start_codon:yes stop_codon:yes gene_type:complete
MNVIEYTGTLPLPDGVYARYFRPGCDNKVEFVRELAESDHYMVLRGLDSDAYLRTYRLNKGDLILYDGDRREVVEKDTLAHKFLQETILPNKEVKRKYWKEYEMETVEVGTLASDKQVWDYNYYCPKCDSSNLMMTCMGIMGGPTKDTNRITCICGWKGKGYECKHVEIAEDYVPDIEQKKIWDKVGSKPENAETSTGVDDIESTGVLGDNVPYTHLNYESPCWRTPYDKDIDLNRTKRD